VLDACEVANTTTEGELELLLSWKPFYKEF